MGYKSPIEITTDLVDGFNLQIEDGVFKAVANYGVKVDKEELLKALAYDRNQYKKGYEDAMAEAIPIKWINEWIDSIKDKDRYKNKYVEIPSEVKIVVYRDNQVIPIPCVSDMIEDWRKENA